MSLTTGSSSKEDGIAALFKRFRANKMSLSSLYRKDCCLIQF